MDFYMKNIQENNHIQMIFQNSELEVFIEKIKDKKLSKKKKIQGYLYWINDILWFK